MPLSKIEWTASQCGWALWHIDEQEENLATMAKSEICPKDIISPLKRLEWLAGRILIMTLTEKAGLAYNGMFKDEYGKPYLNDHPHPISLSHSYPYVAAQLDRFQSVGIDVEQPKEKLLTIAHRVLNTVERKDAGSNIQKNCVYWCAKEALYKIYGKRGLSFAEHLHVQPFELQEKGIINGSFPSGDKEQMIILEYSLHKDFVLVLTKTN